MNESTESRPSGWRLYVAGALVLISLSGAGFIPLVASSSLPTEMKATISGLLLFGIPQLLMVTAVALVGKSGLAYMKGKLFGILKNLAPLQTVGRTRYRIGLILFILPILLGFFTPYLEGHVPIFAEQRIVFSVAGDVAFILSFFVLGGDFWDKIRSLFIHDAKAMIPGRNI